MDDAALNRIELHLTYQETIHRYCGTCGMFAIAGSASPCLGCGNNAWINPGDAKTNIEAFEQLRREHKELIELRDRPWPKPTSQQFIDCHLNVFALQLVVESYTNHPNPKPIRFEYRGCRFEMSLAPKEKTNE